VSDTSSQPTQLPGQPPPDPVPPPPSAGLGFGQNTPISTLPPVVGLTGVEWVPLIQDALNGEPVTMRATTQQIAQTLPANPNAPPAAFAQGQTIVSGPGPTFAWVPTSVGALPVVQSWNGRIGAVVMLSADVTGALGFTPYNATNPQGFQTAAQVSATVTAMMVQPSNATPVMDGAAQPGVSTLFSRGDHVHPTDTSRYSTTNPSNFQTATQVTASLANYLPLTGGTVSGGVAFTTGINLAGPLNLNMGGGTPNQILSTNGSGVLSWISQGGGISDAPSDGQLYGRQNAGWTVVPSGGGGGIPDAPNDGTMYARLSEAWQHITHTNITDWTATLAPYALTANVPVASTATPLMDGTAAVGTGTTWARADHVHPSDTTRITDAPNNANAYVRSGGAWTVLPPVAVTIAAAAPSSPAAGALWWDSVGGQLYVWYNDGTSSQWVIAVNNVAALTGYLPLTGGTLTGDLSGTDATFSGNLGVGNNLTTLNLNVNGAFAANGQAFAVAPPAGNNSNQVPTTAWVQANARYGDNRIINGDMRIDQRNNGAAGSAFGYTVDRWKFNGNVAGKFNWQRNAGAAATQAQFPYYLGFSSSSAYTPLTADFFNIVQIVEADMVSDFAWGTASAQPVTLSFWAYSSLTGAFSGAIQNIAGTRSYPFTFSIPVAATWTKIVITIPGDTAGTWVMSGNGGSMYLSFDLGSGATYRAAAGAWTAGNINAVTGAVSVVATNGAYIFFTGVKLEIGSVATPFNRQSLAQSMADCTRYYQTANVVFGGYTPSAGGAGLWQPLTYPVMRMTPTAVLAGVSYTNMTGLALGNVSANSLFLQANWLASGNGTTQAAVLLSAEL
jgi:hypothetical protein